MAVLAAAVGAAQGAGQALGAAMGVAVAGSALALGTAALDATDRVSTAAVLPVGLVVYGTTVVLLGAVVVRYEHSTGAVVAALPWGVLAGVLTWLPVHCWWAWTSPTPYVDPDVLPRA